MHPSVSQVSTPQPQETADDPFSASYHHVQYEPSAYAPYYAPLLPPYALEPLDFHNYHPNAPRHGVSRPHFMTPDLRDELHRKQDALFQAPYGHPTPPLPDEVHAYHSLAVLEAASSQTFFGGFSTSVYRAVSGRDGNTYVLYRVETLVVVYEYHPLARTLQAQHLAPSTPPGQNGRSQQSSPSKSRTFSPPRNFSPSPFGPGSPTSQFAGSPPFNSPAFASAATFGSPNAQPYNFPQSYSAYSFQNPATRANSLPPSASIAQAFSQSASFNSFGAFSPQSQFSPQMHPRTSIQGPAVPFSQQMGTQPLDERTLWTYLLQLANAVRVVHGRGMAFRCLDAKRVLVTGVGR
ncbi:PAB-dependent poly(A)-specific ribonuclease subunit 3, partial [Ceratobasidium sp. 423]